MALVMKSRAVLFAVHVVLLPSHIFSQIDSFLSFSEMLSLVGLREAPKVFTLV